MCYNSIPIMKLSSLLTFLAPVVCAGSLHAAADYFLEIDGIKGESTDSAHPETVEVLSFSWGCSTEGDFSGPRKVSFQDFTFKTYLSKASPQLLLACANGTSIPEATLYVRKSGEPSQEYYKITMKEILVSSLHQAGESNGAATTGAGPPADQVVFYFNSVAVEHKADDGTITTGRATRTVEQ